MKTIDEVIMNMTIGHILTKYGKRVIPIDDIIECAKERGIKNPRKKLNSDVKFGFLKRVRNYIVVPNYRELKGAELKKHMKAMKLAEKAKDDIVIEGDRKFFYTDRKGRYESIAKNKVKI